MGQSADNLPGPEEHSRPAVPSNASADELLSELADAEINRLLADVPAPVPNHESAALSVPETEPATAKSALSPFESEREEGDLRASPVHGTSAAAALIQANADLRDGLGDLSSELDALIEQGTSAFAPVGPGPSVAPPASEVDLSSELDALMEQGAPARAATPATASAPAPENDLSGALDALIDGATQTSADSFAATASPPTEGTHEEVLSGELDALMDGEAGAGIQSPRSPDPSPVAEVDHRLSAKVDQVFDTTTGPATLPENAPPAQKQSVPETVPAEPIEKEKAPGVAVASAGGIDVLKVLDPIVDRDAEAQLPQQSIIPKTPAVEVAASIKQREALAGDHEAPTSPLQPPLVIRILDLLTFPLLLIPQPWRDAAGKIAILTLFNAGLILLWVMLHRHKGGH